MSYKNPELDQSCDAIRGALGNTQVYLDDGGPWNRRELVRVLLKHALWEVFAVDPAVSDVAQEEFCEQIETAIEELLDSVRATLGDGCRSLDEALWPMQSDDPHQQ